MTIKINGQFITANGKRLKVNYFTGPWVAGVDPATIKIRPRVGSSFPAAFTIENNSDSMTDYFESDCIRLLPGHPLYNAVAEAAK